jgi:hypothetical protein
MMPTNYIGFHRVIRHVGEYGLRKCCATASLDYMCSNYVSVVSQVQFLPSAAPKVADLRRRRCG